MKDFFISYNRADKTWAEWIAWQLEEANYSVIIQAWDFRPGNNFVLKMQNAAADSKQTIAVLSETYLKSSFTQPEWAAAFASDPQSLKRQLVPVRVKECEATGLLASLIYVDLVNLDEATARQTLLAGLADRAKPKSPPDFPGSMFEPKTPQVRKFAEVQKFPSALSRVQKVKEAAWQGQLASLIEDYNAVNRQIDTELTIINQQKLRRKMVSIAEDMDRIAADLDALGQCSYSRQIQRRDLESELEALDEDSRNLTRNIVSALTEVGRGKLKRQQEDVFKRMNEVVDQINQLDREEWDERSKPEHQEFLAILISVDRSLLVNAYQFSLPELINKRIPDELKKMILRIFDLVGQPDEVPPLQRFIKTLISNQALHSNCRAKLENWADKQNILIQGGVVQSTENQEICLMIKVLNSPPSKYTVSAAIVWNPDSWRVSETLLTTALIDLSSAFPTGCSKEELPGILPELIAICGGKYEIALSELTVQWFLPIELMSLDIEHWPIPIGRQQYRNEERCKSVIVRCADRHFSKDYNAVFGEWRKNWQRISPDPHCHQSLAPIDLKKGNTKINWQQTDIVGCHFVEHPNPAQQEVFWDCLISQGLPIAIWVRQSKATKSKTQNVVKSVTNCNLSDLPKSLTSHRQTVSPQISTSNASVVHLSLLWDNPYLRFPTLDYESEST